MSVDQLSSQHFQVVGTKKRTLNIQVPGNVLVFFKMQNCPGCAQFEPVFHQLASQTPTIKHTVADLSYNREIVVMSRQTNTPIEKVPFIMLYVNGRPHAKFNGKKNIPSLQNFITKALGAVPAPSRRPQSSFVQQPPGYAQQPPGYAQQPQYPPQSSKVYQPDLQMPKNMGSVRGSNAGGYKYMNDVEEEDDEKLEIPAQVTPYNTPWNTKYKKMEELD